jgi:hypothetical protein
MHLNVVVRWMFQEQLENVRKAFQRFREVRLKQPRKAPNIPGGIPPATCYSSARSYYRYGEAKGCTALAAAKERTGMLGASSNGVPTAGDSALDLRISPSN